MVASALGTVLSKNPLNSVLFLVTNLLGVAALYAALHAHFLAVVQIIVYAGAIVVLFLFVVMLLNVKVEYEKRDSLLLRLVGFGAAIGFVLITLFAFGTQLSEWSEPEVLVQGTVKNLGQVLYVDYVFLFELVSLVLIAAMAGAVMIARKRKGVTLLPRTSQVQERVG